MQGMDTLGGHTWACSDLSAVDKQWRVQVGPGGTGPQTVARLPPPNSAALLTHRGQLILRKIGKFDAIRCQTLRLKCTKYARPYTPMWELTALPQTLICI